MATSGSFDLTDSKRSLANGADPLDRAPLMRLRLMAPAIGALSAVLNAALSLSRSLYSADTPLRPIDFPRL